MSENFKDDVLSFQVLTVWGAYKSLFAAILLVCAKTLVP